MADFMKLKYENPKLKQSEIAKQLGLSSSTIQRYRIDINMLSPYRIDPDNTKKRSKKASNTVFDINPHHEADVKRPQMNSNSLNTTQTKSNKKNKNVPKAGSVQQNIEINEHYLDKILKNNDT